MTIQGSHTLTAQIKAEAYRVGFDLVGITSPEPPPHMDVYRNWLAAGHHAGMAYLAAERAVQRRTDPRLILENCQSIIVLGSNYLTEAAQSTVTSPGVQVAAYALGDDYHDTLVNQMNELVHFITSLLGETISTRVYTDTGPILERELAQRAGLGWIGKNSCLIHPRLGSYFLLAEILLDAPLEPDLPFQHDRCGSCTRCIDACPTSCILPDRTLDARRCISYLTIEEKGPIPHNLRSAVDKWIFGCDICQQVCPWNLRFARISNAPAYQPNAFTAAADLGQYFKLHPTQWRQTLKGSPLLRPKRVGLLRNAAIVAGNMGNQEFIPQLVECVNNDPEPLVRAHAAWALIKISGKPALEYLTHALTTEDDPFVKEELISLIDQLHFIR
jgi:epoxyqueuosine reductase